MSEFLIFNFGLPGGAVYSNLIASLIWALPGILFLRYHQKKHHRRVEKKLDEIRGVL